MKGLGLCMLFSQSDRSHGIYGFVDWPKAPLGSVLLGGPAPAEKLLNGIAN